jgi:RHS repeat-associated protein
VPGCKKFFENEKQGCLRCAEKNGFLFELPNHLGNVLVTISDRKVPNNTTLGQTITYFKPVVITANDYYPFGMIMPGRNYNAPNAKDYKYGFNGKENDNEVKGEGNQQDYGMRIYDPRLGRFLSVDPLTGDYPWNSPYAFAENDVINNIDLDGAEKYSKDELVKKLAEANSHLKSTNSYYLSIALRGAGDANWNALTMGLSDFFGSTNNLNRYDTEAEREAYLWGRVAGDCNAMLMGMGITSGGLSVARASIGKGAAPGLVVSAGAALAAGYGAGVSASAGVDIAWALGKLFWMKMAKTATDAATAAKSKLEDKANGNGGASNNPGTPEATPGAKQVTNPGPPNTKKGGKITEPKLPPKTVAQEGNIKAVHYTKSGDHGPAHLHIKGGGYEVKIGQNGKPLKGEKELSAAQSEFVNNNKATIRKAVRQIQQYHKYTQQ